MEKREKGRQVPVRTVHLNGKNCPCKVNSLWTRRRSVLWMRRKGLWPQWLDSPGICFPASSVSPAPADTEFALQRDRCGWSLKPVLRYSCSGNDPELWVRYGDGRRE